MTIEPGANPSLPPLPLPSGRSRLPVSRAVQGSTNVAGSRMLRATDLSASLHVTSRGGGVASALSSLRFFASQSLLRSKSGRALRGAAFAAPIVAAHPAPLESQGSLLTALSQLRSKSGPSVHGRAFAAIAAHPASPARRDKGPLDLCLLPRLALAPAAFVHPVQQVPSAVLQI